MDDDDLDECCDEQAGRRPPGSPVRGKNGRGDNAVRVGMAVMITLVLVMPMGVIRMIGSMAMIMPVIVMFMVFCLKDHCS
jgi:hypothetical protein